MELTWCKIKSGFILEPMRRRRGRMLELDTGGRLQLKPQIGTGRVVCAEEPEVNSLNHEDERRIRGIREVSAGHANFAGTAGHGIDPDGLNLIIVKPSVATKGFYRILAGEQGQIVYTLNRGASTAWIYDVNGNLVNVQDAASGVGFLRSMIYWGARWYGWRFSP